ncbi:MAG: type II secretion system protein GspJ [Bacillota bacterium]|nr:type II secretion system protein GspJ [Bacillota bacterium]
MSARYSAPHTGPARRERGFTLMEVVSALALTALTLMTVAGVYFVLHRSLSALVAADAQARQRAVYRRLRADLEAAYTSPNPALPSFSGEPDRLSFAARLGPSGLSRVEYTPGREGFERRVTPWVAGGEDGAGGAPGVLAPLSGTRSAVLLESVREIRFRYLSRAGGWSTRWGSEIEGGLPVAVELAVGGAGTSSGYGSERLWVFPLHAGAPAGAEP